MKNEFTVKEAAEILGLSQGRIRQLAANKEIETRKFGMMLIITAEGLKQAKARNTKPGPSNKQAA